jgi:glutathione S-transferase
MASSPEVAEVADVVLHQWEISPFCHKVRKMLRFKGIAHRVENYNGLRALKASRLAPSRQLPVLDWGPERVADSASIAAFIDQRVPSPPLCPANVADAALARRYEDWAGSSLYHYGMYLRVEYAEPRARSIALLCEGRPAWERVVFTPAYTRQLRAKVDALGLNRRDGQAIEAAFLRIVDDLDTTLAERGWLVGDACSIADLAVGAQLEEVLRTSTLADRIRLRSNVVAWLAKLP